MPQEETGTEDGRRVRLSSQVAEAKTRFGYEYDFGDDWQHAVLVEKILLAYPNTPYPLCLAGKRAYPPEDCGGSWGYAELLKLRQNPKHPEYREMRQWAGQWFDREAFDLEEVNQKLRRLRV
jgi:hypothetical protein